MNFIFISPQFPHTYWNFCDRLKKLGVNVLGIGDSSYESLDDKLKAALTEYYKVNSLSSYDEVFKAVAFFSFKYGKIDALESNNEFWLLQDAQLREDFNIKSGANVALTERYKSKSGMKKYYKKASIPVARYYLVKNEKGAKEFIKEVGYPVIAKPDIGVGANDTYKIKDDAELESFFQHKSSVPYIMEEFIYGDIYSYDAIIDASSTPLFESMTFWPPSIMDIVNDELELAYYVAGDVNEKLREYGRAAVKAFGVFSRFVHLEFFRLKKDKEGLGKKGDFVALEVNMRPAGGYTPDMIDYAHGVDVYQMWAEMMVYNRLITPVNDIHNYCVYTGRRDRFNYLHSEAEIYSLYGDKIVMAERMPGILRIAMGDQSYTAKAKTKKEAEEFINFVLSHKE